MSSLVTRKVLFFIAGNAPTQLEQSLIDRIVGQVQIRSVLADSTFAGNLESADAVAGLAAVVPSVYSDAYDVVTPDNDAPATVADADAVSSLSDTGVKASLTTALTGSNNDLVFTAKQRGAIGNDITVGYADQSASPGSPLGISVILKAIGVKLASTLGTKQKTTATVVGTITPAVKQVETATAGGTVTAGIAQVETATVVGTITGAGNVKTVVTAAGLAGSPLTLDTAVANSDTAAVVAGKIIATLQATPAITALFAVGGTGATVSLTKLVTAANDGTLNIETDNDGATGLTHEATSANTTAGVASGAGNAKAIVTAAGLVGSPLTVDFAVADGDTPALWAAKARTALVANAAIAALFSVGGSTTAIALTALNFAANDSSLNIELNNDTSTGITHAASSANTTAGTVGGGGNCAVVITSAVLTGSPLSLAVPVLESDTAAVVAQKIRNVLTSTDSIIGVRPNRQANAKFVVGGSGADVSLLRTAVAANDGTLNISVDNGTCAGLTTEASSVATIAGAAPAISTIASDIAAAIAANPDAAALVTVANAGGNTGAGLVTALAPTNLTSGADPTVSATVHAVVSDGALLGVN